ncbi:MAG: sulfate ABC transporter permease subunit CysT [Ruminococcus sp.]|nr:sulfate ABC transporter permease subunit CysT [Ruminococcus sp.]
MKRTLKGRRNVRVIPGFGLTMGITVTMLSTLVIIPLASVLLYSIRLTPAEFFELITAPNVISAFLTSIVCAFIAAFINSVFGLILAWVLVRYDFFGKRILDGLIELPFALPTAVAGITLSKMYSNTGFPGKFFSGIGLDISYTHIGIVIALVFVGIPFTVRSVQPVLEALDGGYEEVAYTLGASRIRTFFKVIFPELFPSLLTGFSLALARGIGEYGSVIYISGNSAKNGTQVVSYVIMQKLERLDYSSATAIALVMLIISFVLMFAINIIQIRRSRRVNAR